MWGAPLIHNEIRVLFYKTISAKSLKRTSVGGIKERWSVIAENWTDPVVMRATVCSQWSRFSLKTIVRLLFSDSSDPVRRKEGWEEKRRRHATYTRRFGPTIAPH